MLTMLIIQTTTFTNENFHFSVSSIFSKMMFIKEHYG